MPKVSVVMPVYNGAPFIAQSVRSILDQTLEDLELIVVDDGSQDGTPEIVQGFRDERLRLLHNEQNRGIVFSRNLGVAAARGDYIAMLDADDIALPGRLAEQAAFLDRHPDYGLLGSWFEVIDREGRATGEVKTYPASAEEIPVLLLFNNCFAQSTVMVRKKLLPEGPYRQLAQSEDYDLWIRIAARAKVGTLQKVLVRYRLHGGNVSLSRAAEQETCTRQVIAACLAEIGIQPSDEEMELHRQLANMRFAPTPDFLRQSEAWLGKLLQANLNSRRFDRPVFGRLVAALWYSCCRNCSTLGRGAWNSYWSSPLSALGRLRITQTIRFFLLTTLKGARPGATPPPQP